MTSTRQHIIGHGVTVIVRVIEHVSTKPEQQRIYLCKMYIVERLNMGPRAYSRHSGPEDLKTNPVLPAKLIKKGFPIVL